MLACNVSGDHSESKQLHNPRSIKDSIRLIAFMLLVIVHEDLQDNFVVLGEYIFRKGFFLAEYSQTTAIIFASGNRQVYRPELFGKVTSVTPEILKHFRILFDFFLNLVYSKKVQDISVSCTFFNLICRSELSYFAESPSATPT